MIGQVTSLAMMMLLTACVTETPLSSAGPITTPPPSSPVAAEQPAIEDDVAVQKLAMILCVNRKTFKKTVQNERLKFYGIVPTADKIMVEIYTALPEGSGFTIAMRDAVHDEVCIMLAGSELVPVAWFSESGI